MDQYRTPEEAKQLLHQLGAHSPDIIWMFSPDWNELKFIGDAYEDIWGRSISTLTNNPTDFLKGVHPDDRAKVKEKMEHLSNEEAIEVELRVNAHEEYQRQVWVEGEPIFNEDDEFVAVAGFVRDITDRKQYEQDLKRKNQRLDNFAAVVSHDLRNPLHVAMGRLDLTQEECNSEHLDHIEQSLTRIATLTDDLLVLAQEGKKIGNVESVALEDLVKQCWRNVETEGVTLVNNAEAIIQADASRLQQLLENLIRNAVEHSEDGITINVGDLTDGFYVEDDGPGIPEEEREDVLEMGYSGTDNGTGLGLAIANEIADGHDWTFTVTESMEGGARFEITDVEAGY